MNETPKGLRLHIGLFGRRNVGKSSLLNALTGQSLALVSATPGTTTDPVEKAMELAPLGPVVFVDTAGLDDEGELGQLRVARSQQALGRVDVALLVSDGRWGQAEVEAAALLQRRGVPFAVVQNKADMACGVDGTTSAHWDGRVAGALPKGIAILAASARSGQGLDAIRAALVHLAAQARGDGEQTSLLADLLPPDGLALLVVPVDSGAPRGRLILPQVQAIRDCLDHDRLCMMVTEARLPVALTSLGRPPDLVVCDSQVVSRVVSCLRGERLPAAIPMTTFSILMARHKGDLLALSRGTAALTRLEPGDHVLIQESCTHHPQQDDIGRVKLPRLLQKLAGGPLQFSWHAGRDFPAYDTSCKVVVHCGGCMLSRRQMLARLEAAAEAGLPMTNYGLAISLAQGVLVQALAPFPDALRAFTEMARPTERGADRGAGQPVVC